MGRQKTGLNILHFNVTIRMNDDNYRWNDPYAERSLEFSIPETMFSKAQFADLVKQMIDVLGPDYDLAKVEHQARIEAEKLAEEAKAKAEASV